MSKLLSRFRGFLLLFSPYRKKNEIYLPLIEENPNIFKKKLLHKRKTLTEDLFSIYYNFAERRIKK